jgi:hypothetical protein
VLPETPALRFPGAGRTGCAAKQFAVVAKCVVSLDWWKGVSNERNMIREASQSRS